MAAREIGAKARVSYLDTNDIDSLDVSVARPLPVVDAAGNIAIAATTTAVNAVKTAVDLTTAAVAAAAVPSSPPTTGVVTRAAGSDTGVTAVKPITAATKGWVLQNCSDEGGGAGVNGWVGASGVDSTTGFCLRPGQYMSGKDPAALYGYPLACTFSCYEEH